ncbi:hypothetical protein HPB47_026760 [Ixodes persulcatus]|uniref:Uncharacterized protein n=1 Tax=Ixodes persulcatus TaxID=34615 RepID=A0AC60PXU3_IXOPE|nr:hypothetical protein HPB47_026760 [Ixodes persulcatus]
MAAACLNVHCNRRHTGTLSLQLRKNLRTYRLLRLKACYLTMATVCLNVHCSLEAHGDSIIAVKEEPTDVEWQSSNQEESCGFFAHEQWDQEQQEEQYEPKSYDCRFCSFSSFIKSKVLEYH